MSRSTPRGLRAGRVPPSASRTAFNWRRVLVQLGLACLPPLALADAPPVNVPDAGSLLRQLQPAQGLTLSSDDTLATSVAPARAAAPRTDDGVRFEVRRIRLLGLSGARIAALQPLLERRLGANRSLQDLEEAAQDIEAALQRDGLFLAQVCVPAQAVDHGDVVLQVYEGRLGEVTLTTGAGVEVDRDRIEDVLAPLRGHPRIERGLIEAALLTLGDLRGIKVTTALTPGAEPGTADLAVNVESTPGRAFEAEFDNAGSVFTGRARLYGNADWFNLAHRGDDVSLRTQVSERSQYMRLSWLLPVGPYGDRWGVQASVLDYRLGTPLLKPLDADGDAWTLGWMLLHPLMRSRNANAFLQVSVETRRFDDHVHAVQLDAKKGVAEYGSFGLTGDFRDALGGGGITNYSVQLVLGELHLQTPSEQALDALTYHSNGNYAKAVANIARLQSVTATDSVYLAAQLQLASKNLDSSEKFNVGGLYGLRGYPSPESPSDEALVTSWEWRHPFVTPRLPGEFVFSVFGDYGVMRAHWQPLPTDVDNMYRLVDHGIALTRTDASGLLLRASLAVRGNRPAQSDDGRVRLLLQASKSF